MLPAAISCLSRVTLFYLGEITHICPNCGAKHWLAESSAGSTKKNLVWNSCCKNGLVVLDALSEPPAYIKNLYDDPDVRRKKIRELIRQYNSAFAFSSVGCFIHNQHIGYMTFHIHGQMYHVQWPLTSADPSSSRYTQLYILDFVQAANTSYANNKNLDSATLRNFSITLSKCNSMMEMYTLSFAMTMNKSQVQSLETVDRKSVV